MAELSDDLTPCQQGFHFAWRQGVIESWCVRCGDILDDQGKSTGVKHASSLLHVLVNMTLLAHAERPGKPLTWAVERGCLIITCANGHEMGIAGHTYTRHLISDDGTISPSVLCPAPDCDFSQMCKLNDYTPSILEMSVDAAL